MTGPGPRPDSPPAAAERVFVYLSELLGRRVAAADGRRLGKLVDLKVRLGEAFPKVVTARVRARRGGALAFPWPGVAAFAGDTVVMRPGAEPRPAPPEVPAEEMLLREELLDKQVLDMSGAKIERVNDVHLLVHDGDLRLVHVDIGKRGILRRLGLLRPVEGLTRWFFEYEFPEVLVSWKHVQPLGADLGRADLKLSVGARGLHDLHPSELADILEDLDRENQERVFEALDLGKAADTLQEVDPRLQRSLLEAAPLDKASGLLEEMEPDEATELLAELSEDRKAELFRRMRRPRREVLEELLTYKEGTAGRIMTKDFLAVREDRTIGDAVRAFRDTAHPLESSAYIFVIDPEGRPRGVITLRHLLLAGPETPVRSLMNPRLVTVRADDGIESAADVLGKYKFLMVPVVDAAGVLAGVITYQDIMEETR